MFCWRVQPREVDVSFNETSLPECDDPSQIVDGCIEAQRRILTGYKAHPKINKKRYAEALEPKHAAISLAGEPTIYPRLGELNSEFQKRGFTTFIVTNGTKPNILKEMESEPSQLYVSLSAPNLDSFNKLCRPQIPKAWIKLNQTLELLSSFNCPTVLRFTLVQGLNMKHPEKYARLIDKTNPTYIETKAYVFVGYSRKRLSFHNMPIHKEIQCFVEDLKKFIGYNTIDESRASRVVLLSRLKKVKKFN
jgi:tRNA wybutosine-synthesizing protein 1